MIWPLIEFLQFLVVIAFRIWHSQAKCVVMTAVCVSLTACLHCCTDPDIGLISGKPCVLVTCAVGLLGGFGIGARVSLLWQHTRPMRSVGEDASCRCMAGLFISWLRDFCLKFLQS